MSTDEIIWLGDAMAYALTHVERGVLDIDRQGRIWRRKVRTCSGYWKDVAPRRAENVGGKGYLRVSLHIPSLKRLAIVMAHNLVWEAKVGRVPDGLELNHKDLDKTNNRISNLEPVTPAQNVRHSYDNNRRRPWSIATVWRPGHPRITREQIEIARSMRASGALLREVAAQMGISTSHMWRITQ